MSKLKPFGLMAVGLLTACQQLDKTSFNESEEYDEMQVSIVASIGMQNQKQGRTTSDGGKAFSFCEGDDMGIFMQEGGACKWELQKTNSSTKWKSETPMKWEDEVAAVTFYAYSPYARADSKDAVPMPDLSKQTGTLEDIGKYDFLVTRCTTSYKNGGGQVNFTGDKAFSHVSSLVAFTIQGDPGIVGANVQKISFKAPGIATRTQYVFSDVEGKSIVEALSSAQIVKELELPMKQVINEDGMQVYAIINSSENTPLFLSITYTRNDVTYETAEADLGSDFLSNNMYTYSLSINKGEVTITGTDISDWIVNDRGEVKVDEVVAEVPVI